MSKNWMDKEVDRNKIAYREGYNKAIDDFKSEVKNLIVDLNVIRFKDIDEMRELFTDNLNRLKERNAFAFPLTVSLGAVVMRSDEVNSLDEYMRRADEAMYIEKQKFHNKE